MSRSTNRLLVCLITQTNKNSKIYHKPGCPGYQGVSEKNQVKFNSVSEAEAAGYTLAKNCKK
jgi:methylphosphotriester-DNA--protein-cysteine methyltransferase